MPGLFGGTGAPAILGRLEQEFATCWDDCVVQRAGAVVLGGHAFHRMGPLSTDGRGRLIGIDGEIGLYEDFAPGRPDKAPAYAIEGDILELVSAAAGNVTVAAEEALYVACDWSASFPLYYCEQPDGFYFSTHLRPLARALRAERDLVGVLEFLREGFTIGRRTPFRNVHRLLGGQSLTFRRGTGLRVVERSGAWVGLDERYRRADVAVEAAIEALRNAFRSMPDGVAPAGLMMSAGWDSRTLLATAQLLHTPERVLCYSHGDPGSRELRLAARIAASQGTPWQARALGDDMYDLEELHRGFARTESVVFPHWLRAGRLLAQQKARFVIAGVSGEMLGGRYWMAHALTGTRKALALFPALLRREGAAEPPLATARSMARDMFRVTEARNSWPVSGDAFGAIPGLKEEINGDIDHVFDRYDRNGVGTLNQLAEAYQGEHIGSRYCNVQLLSCRSHLDVAMPLVHRELLRVATRTPIQTKMQNELNRRLIRRIAPDLLRFPMAATLVPAASPIVFQEASRVVRKGVQAGRWALYSASGGRIPRPRLQWADYEFLRSGATLRAIVENLQSDLWDRDALQRSVESITRGQAKHDLLPMADRIARILTVDLMLR